MYIQQIIAKHVILDSTKQISIFCINYSLLRNIWALYSSINIMLLKIYFIIFKEEK